MFKFVLTLGLLMALVISSINCNGLRDNIKRNVVFEYLERKKITVAFLQETHSEDKDESLWKKQWGGDIIFSHGLRNSRGVAILISNKISHKLINTKTDKEGRWVMGDIQWNGQTITLMSAYAPNDMYPRKNFFQEVNHHITNCNKCIIGGDLNCQIDKGVSKDKSCTSLIDLLQQNKLIDIWRTVYPNKEGFTYYHKGKKTPSRIDYILMSDELQSQTHNVCVSVIGFSDHNAITIRLTESLTVRGPGRWICNNESLKDQDCINRVENFWRFWKTKKCKLDNIIDWWEMGKYKIKEILREYGVEKANSKKTQRDKLQKQYFRLIEKSNNNNHELLNEIKSNLKAYEIEEWEKAQVRTRIRKKTEGEKPSKFFLSIEKQQNQYNTIKAIKDNQGNTLDKPVPMVKCVNEFYRNLYTSDMINTEEMETIINAVQTKNIDNPKDLEEDINETELSYAIRQMNKNTSPGIDGLTVEFYLTFWSILKDDLLEIIKACKEMGSLSCTMNTALIRLIYKNKGERDDLKNWRPISLLTVDYKIISKVLTNRLRKVMPTLIGEEQTCGVHGRNIHNNLMILRDVVDDINYNGKKAAVLSIDQEKAFDKIEWRYMYEIMGKLGIPDGLIDWIKMLYNHPMSCVIVNNFIGEPFSVTRGIRQGCPLSPLLYAICAEGLASLIRFENNLKGIIIPRTKYTVKLVQHADDTTVFLTNNEEFPKLTNILKIFSEGTGSKINQQKTTGLWLGTWKTRTDKPGGYKWVNDKIKILGINFGNQVTEHDNWDPQINKFKRTLNRFKERDLTLRGKAVIVNSYIGAGISYLGSILPCDKETIKTIDNIIFDFYWSGKPDKIKRDTIRGQIDKGGTGLMNTEHKLKSLKIKWLKRYNTETGKWKQYFDYWLNRASNYELGWYTLEKSKGNNQTTTFYREIIKAFKCMEGRINICVTSMLEAHAIPLWNNNMITGNKHKKLNSNVLKANGFYQLGQILSDGQNDKNIAEQCNLRVSNAGKIIARLKKNINPSLLKENREGPPVHVSKVLEIKDYQRDNDFVPISKLTTKQLYQNLVAKTFVEPTAEKRWECLFNRVTKFDWELIWKKGYNKLIDQTDRDLWFRLKHRILPTKDKLYKMKITVDNKCLLCNEEIETIEHLFLYCEKHLEAWIFVEHLLKKYTGKKTFYLNDCDRIMGNGEGMEDIALILVCRLHKIIWNIRCELALNKTSNRRYILPEYKRNLKRHITFENKRLNEEDFKKLYTRNSALCSVKNKIISFNF